MTLPDFLCKLNDSKTLSFVRKRQNDKRYEYFSKGSLIWIPHQDHAYIPAKVKVGFGTGSSNGVAIIKEDGEVKDVPMDEETSSKVIYMGQENLECIGHMQENLPDLSEAALLHNIRLNFEYGYKFVKICDNMLMFLDDNVGETDILSLSEVDDGTDSAEKTPARCKDSLASTVDNSFGKLVSSRGKSSQSIIVTGVRDSGKRQVSRFVLLRAIQLAKPTSGVWWQRLLAADSVLEMFGDVDGFIRWSELDLLFHTDKKGGWFGRTKSDDNQVSSLTGAKIRALGLDRSRVTDQTRTFPVFHALLSNANLVDKPFKAKYQIGGFDDYAYVPSPGVTSRDISCKVASCSGNRLSDLEFCVAHCSSLEKHCNDPDCSEWSLGDGFCKEHGPKLATRKNPNPVAAARGWPVFMAALETLGISDSDREDIVNILHGILHLGNIQFSENPEQVNQGRTELGVPVCDLLQALRTKTLRVRDETFKKERTVEEKRFSRDGLARSLYHQLFEWVLATINRGICEMETGNKSKKGKKKDKKAQTGSISVIENAAMELKASNLEDLFQNYRLECFHHFISNKIMQRNAKMLLNRDAVKIKVGNLNHDCLSLLMNGGPSSTFSSYVKRVSMRMNGNKPPGGRKAAIGILQMVDEEILQPGGTDKNLVRKIFKKQEKNPALGKSIGENAFVVKHFGGSVSYNIEGLLARSRANVVPEEVVELLSTHSNISLLRNILCSNGDGFTKSEKIATVATATKIHNEMESTIKTLGETDMQYVICIGSKSSSEIYTNDHISPQFVLSQIRNTGVKDIVSRRLYNSLRGPGVKPQEFWERFRCLHKEATGYTKKDITSLCQALSRDGLLTSPWDIGSITSNVFLTTKSQASLENAVSILREDATLFIQKRVRCFLARLQLIYLMQEKIKDGLYDATEANSRDDLIHWVAQADKWKLRHRLVAIANSKIERIKKDALIVVEIENAVNSNNLGMLYKGLQDAEKSGLTCSDFAIIGVGLAKLKTSENTVISKEDREKLAMNFSMVTSQLKRNQDQAEHSPERSEIEEVKEEDK